MIMEPDGALFKLKAVDSQHLMIEIFKYMDAEAVLDIVVKLYSLDDMKLKVFIEMCISFGRELRKNPEYCSTFDSACRSIIARQRSIEVETVRKTDYVRELGFSNVQMRRVEDGKSQMSLSSISKICENFKAEHDRRFWTNYLLCFFPSTQKMETDEPKVESVEYSGLLYILNMLNREEFTRLKHSLSNTDWEKITGLKSIETAGKPKSRVGDSPAQLYDTIRNLCREINITVQSLAEDELQTSLNTWYAWEQCWIEAAKADFEWVPSNGGRRESRKLRRYHFLVMAVVFKLEFLDMIKFLQLGGYRFANSETDRMVADYFLRTPTAKGTNVIKNIIFENRMDRIYT